MSLVEHYTFGETEHTALSLVPCLATHEPRTEAVELSQANLRHDLLRTLHPNGYRDMRAFATGEKPFTFNFSVDNLDGVDDFAAKYHDRNVYIGVAPRADFKGRNLDACAALYALFADLDFKEYASEAAARASLAAFPLTPSAVVASGGGLQAYWFLTEPLNLQDGGGEHAKQLLRSLATVLGADLNAAEPARILRLPDTFNYKYTPARPVSVEAFDATRRYTIDAFLPVCTTPATPITAATTQRGTPPSLPAEIAKNRNVTLTTEAGKLHRLGLSPKEILATLVVINRDRCRPPLPVGELESIANSAATWPKATPGRVLRFAFADTITPRPVHWLWTDRLALGSLSLVAGREGIGKTTWAYTLAADITRGQLKGKCFGEPRTVVVAATEDSWEHTIVPRLMAAGADLARIGRVEVTTADGTESELTLPRDIAALTTLTQHHGAALILLDPLISRLSSKLDTHKDAEVRIGLEPIVRLAHDSNTAVLGIIHVNKGSSRDPLNMVMGSRAFTAVARAVLFVAENPDEDNSRVLGQAKNNLGRSDLPTLTFTIENSLVATTPEGDIYTGKLRWTGESDRSIQEVVEVAGISGETRTATKEAAEWLKEFLQHNRGVAESTVVKREGKKAGHSSSTLKNARKAIMVTSESHGFPRHTYWLLPGTTLDLCTLADAGDEEPHGVETKVDL